MITILKLKDGTPVAANPKTGRPKPYMTEAQVLRGALKLEREHGIEAQPYRPNGGSWFVAIDCPVTLAEWMIEKCGSLDEACDEADCFAHDVTWTKARPEIRDLWTRTADVLGDKWHERKEAHEAALEEKWDGERDERSA